MKTKIHSLLIALALFSALNLQLTTAFTQDTAFTYQGCLNSGSAPASGNDATVGGGDNNTAQGAYATVSGGEGNTASGFSAAVGGGSANTASGDDATVAGGNGNTAGGDYSFAAGNLAHAGHNGSFVWADNNSPFTFSSTTANQFRVRATGGVGFATAIDSSGNVTAGVHLPSGGTAWSSVSDRNAKKNFQPVDGKAVLDQLAAIPVEKWNYKWEPDTSTPNIGPMAQDFKGAFYPGRDDKSISTLEFDGIELAAIQGLNEKVEARSQNAEVSIRKLEAENDELKQRLAALEKIVLNQKSN
jgi:trimeric autotransporter adhesin